MTLEEAIQTAIDYEIRVRDTYFEAMNSATDETGRKVFKTLGNEEQGHVVYLTERLEEWRETGTISVVELETVVPSVDLIEEGVAKLQERLGKTDRVLTAELEMPRKALDVEIETGNFYRRMVDELDAEGQQLFERFLEIEDGHKAIVQAEIDMVSGTGFWFDFAEFNLEGA